MHLLYKAHENVDNESSNKNKVERPGYPVRLNIELLLFLRWRITNQVLAIQPECLIVNRFGFMLLCVRINMNLYHHYIQQVQSYKRDKTQ